MNRAEFIAYVEGGQKALRRFLTAVCCGDSQLADDIAQETLIKAWLACDSFRHEAEFSSWVRKIAFNTFLNHRRSASHTADIEESRNVASTARADDAFKYQGLYDALSKLTPRERTSIALHYLDGYSVKEIADIEGSTVDAVKQHLARGRRHLQELLTE